ALGERLHHAVLDAVVDHLDEVPGADRSGVHEAAALVGGERVEDGPGPRHVLGAAADHDAAAVLPSPAAAADARVEVLDPALGELLGVLAVVLVVGVAALDDEVALLQQRAEFPDAAAGGFAGGDHQPDDPRSRQPLDEFGDGPHVAHVGVEVETDDVMALVAQPRGHVAAHLSEADHAELHARVSLLVPRSWIGGVAGAVSVSWTAARA